MSLISGLSKVIQLYNASHGIILKERYFNGIKPKIVILSLLKTDHMTFLHQVMPSVLSMDLRHISQTQLLHLRNIYVRDFKHTHLENNSDRHDLTLSQNIIILAHLNPDDLMHMMTHLVHFLHQSKSIPHHTAFSFFKEPLHEPIHAFSKKIHQLTHPFNPSSKSELLDALTQLHKQLKSEQATRALEALDNAIDTFILQQDHQANR